MKNIISYGEIIKNKSIHWSKNSKNICVEKPLQNLLLQSWPQLIHYCFFHPLSKNFYFLCQGLLNNCSLVLGFLSPCQKFPEREGGVYENCEILSIKKYFRFGVAIKDQKFQKLGTKTIARFYRNYDLGNGKRVAINVTVINLSV